MWKNITNKLLEQHYNESNVQQYCLYFLSLLENKYSIIPLEVLQKKLNATPNIISLTNISSTISDYLNDGNIELSISLIYHFFDIDFSEDFYEKPIFNNLKCAYEEIFNFHSQHYFYRSFHFEPEILLSKDKQDNLYLFLFLYFLPYSKNSNLLSHPQNNLPLITYCCITDVAFDMLVFLMNYFEKEHFGNLCKNYNFNLMLIEDFMNNTKQLYSFTDDIDWYEVLPIYKISVLLDYGCDFSKFTELRDQKNFFTFPYLATILKDYEKEHQFNKLNVKLPIKKSQHYKIIKI